MTLNLIVIFNSITDIYFLKYVTKIFCISYYFQEKNERFLRCSFQWLCMCIFYQLKELSTLKELSCKYSIWGLWETFKETSCMKSFSTEAAVLKCIPSNFLVEICRSFRNTSEKLVLENYVSAYHTADKNQAKIL